MEASKFGFGEDTPPAFKFDPTDADLVVHYLLPRALGLHNPHKHAIIEEDPGSVPPWEILERHGHVANADHVVHAFFFGPPTDASQNGGRKSRTVQGSGVWQGQKGTEETVTLVRPGGGEVDIRFKRYNLTFSRTKHGPSTGYVMHEYEILSPPLPGTVLTRIKAKKGAHRPPSADGADKQKAVIQVPDPSYEYGAATNGEGFAGAQDGAPYDSNGGSGIYYTPLQYDLPVCDYDNNYCDSIQNQPGISYNYNATAMIDNGEGFTVVQDCVLYDNNGGGGICYTPLQYDLPVCDYNNNNCIKYNYNAAATIDNGEGFTRSQSQAHAFYGARMLEAADAYYYDPSNVPECGAKFGNYYGDYQQWQYQQDPSNQCQKDPSNHCQAGDASVMCADREGFTGKQQTGAPCGNSDKGSVVGTEASTHSTISLCGDDGEEECDDTTFYNALFNTGGDDKREQI